MNVKERRIVHHLIELNFILIVNYELQSKTIFNEQ